MKITIPRRHACYIALLVEGGAYANNSDAAAASFRYGLDEGEMDAPTGAPDMELSLLRGIKTAIEVRVSRDDLRRLSTIADGYGMQADKAAAVVFLQGLFNHWPQLRSSPLYAKSGKYRRLVKAMPHDLFYEEAF